MENQPSIAGQKQPFFDGKVAGLGFVVLAILMYVLPQVLIMILPSLFYGDNAVPYFLEGSIAFISLIVGLVVGMKAKQKPFVSGATTGVISLIFAEFAIVPSSMVGLQSFLQYALIILLPVVVGALVGGTINKAKETKTQ